VRRAARVDANQAEIVAALRAAGATVWILGLPVDLLVGKAGHTLLVEVKTIEGKRKPHAARYTDLQREFLATWKGGPVATVTDVAGALRVLGMMG
jgi:phosphoserine phosphatase